MATTNGMMLFCNIGWMERYEGLHDDDRISGGGRYVKETGSGHEVCNFLETGGRVFGVVEVPGETINLDRIGESNGGDDLTGVTTVWTATRPSGGTVVVGWYRNATVYRRLQPFPESSITRQRDGIDGFWITAAAAAAALLDVDARTLAIPRQSSGGMGQANIWYADSPESRDIRTGVLRLIDGTSSHDQARNGSARQADPLRKAKVEETAIQCCTEHYEALGYNVDSVEKCNKGWDLEATSGRITLHIEVKGLSGDAAHVELTPNEYKAFARQSDEYRLAIVTTALSTPTLRICRYSPEQTRWLIDEHPDLTLDQQPRQGAVIRLRSL